MIINITSISSKEIHKLYNSFFPIQNMEKRVDSIKEPIKPLSQEFIWKFTLKELIWILIAILLFWIIIGLDYDPQKQALNFRLNPSLLLVAAIIIIVSIFAKKIAAPRYSSKIEHDLWWFRRWGWYKRSYLPKPFPMGIVFPLLLTVFSLGYIKPMAFLQYNAENDYPRRILKKQGSRRAQRKTELNESDLAYISAYSFYSLLLLAIIGTALAAKFNISFGYELAKYSIFYGAWNLIPFGQLDGAKTFFGSPVAYSLLLIFYLIALFLVIIF